MSAVVMLWAVHFHPPLRSPTMFGNALWPGVHSLLPTLMPLLIATLLGLLLGMRHACEPDHLLAVSTLISRERSILRATQLGVSWGVGHTASLFAVGTALALVHLRLPAGFPLRLSSACRSCSSVSAAARFMRLGIRERMVPTTDTRTVGRPTSTAERWVTSMRADARWPSGPWWSE
jgi:hypothetical protein